MFAFSVSKASLYEFIERLKVVKGSLELMEASPLSDNSSISSSKEGACDTVATAAILTKKSSIGAPSEIESFNSKSTVAAFETALDVVEMPFGKSSVPSNSTFLCATSNTSLIISSMIAAL